MIFDERKVEEIAKDLGYKNLKRYTQRGKFLFRDITIKEKRLLEIGCGRGAWALWGAINGAQYALGIEPELSGSSIGSLAIFQNIIDKFSLGNVVETAPISFQELDLYGYFDIVIMFNVINHLREEAVIDLDKSISKQELYILELKKVRNLLKRNGILIVTDCGRSNLWSVFGLRTPFAPMINWRVHQDPDLWITLFQKGNFSLVDLRWSPLAPLYSLSANRLVQWLTMSHFVLRFRAA